MHSLKRLSITTNTGMLKGIFSAKLYISPTPKTNPPPLSAPEPDEKVSLESYV
jgi:hypothetical protein